MGMGAARRGDRIGVPSRAEPTLPAPRVRAPLKEGIKERFAATEDGVDLTEAPIIGPVLKKGLRLRIFQFTLIIPNQIVFWLVVISGLIGTADATMNFGAAITWYIWFAIIFIMTLALGRAWCVMCPFGGFGEWIQRRTFWQRTQKSLGLGWKMPENIARLGLVISATMFIGMTWAEEYLNIAGPGAPYLTSIMILGIVGTATLIFLLFERRTFCRYICPLSCMQGTAGSNGIIAGFRPKDRDKCLACATKECMRGGKEGYGCPWYVYPASSDTNAYCGLCSECYKACPNDNIGLYAQKPLTSVITPKKRPEIAWVAAMLLGLVIFQSWNALGSYTSFDNRLNSATNFPHYPNPVDYVLTIAGVVVLLAGTVFLVSRLLAKRDQISKSFTSWFAPLMYGLLPLVGTDFVARAMPKFLNHAARMPASVLHVFGVNVGWADYHILPNNWVVAVQYGIAGLGILATTYATYKIAGRDLEKLSSHRLLVKIIPVVIVLAIGAGTIAFYWAMNGAE